MKSRFYMVLLALLIVANAYSQQSQSLPTALFSQNIRLDDGDSICITPEYPSDEFCSREKLIVEKYKNQIMSSAILKSFEIQKHEEEVFDLIDYNTYRVYKKHPLYDNCTMFSSDYFHGLLKVKAVRKFGYKLLSDILVDYCRYFPKDFRVAVIGDLEETLDTIKKCKKHHYECVDDCLRVDGQMNHDLAYTLEGFIARRICLEGIPASELEDFVKELLKRIKSVDTKDNPDILFKTTINNELSYCLGISGPCFISEKTGKKTIPYDTIHLLPYSYYYGQKVFYNKGYDGTFYKICNQNHNRDGCKPLGRYYKDVRELIIDAEGNEIYRNKAKPED